MGLLGGPRSRSPPEEGRTACSRPQEHGEDSQHGTCPLRPGTFETRRSSSRSEHPSPHTNSNHLLLDSTSSISGRPDAAQCVAECRTGEPPVSQGRESSPAQPRGAKAARQAWGRSCPVLPGSAHHGRQVKTNKNPGGTCWLIWGTANSHSQFPRTSADRQWAALLTSGPGPRHSLPVPLHSQRSEPGLTHSWGFCLRQQSIASLNYTVSFSWG